MLITMAMIASTLENVASFLKGVRVMWISKVRWTALEKRVADLERKVQGQPENIRKINLDRISRQGVEEAFEVLFHQKEDELDQPPPKH